MAKVSWQLGKVIWFNEFSGEGEIRDQDGNDFFVHYSAIESKQKWKKLKSEKDVKFALSDDPKRPQIARVKEL